MTAAAELAVLTVVEMAHADRLAIQAGVSAGALMERAGRGTAQVVQRRFPASPVVVLCGPGNNGGDGFVIARILKQAGWPVRLVTPDAVLAALTGPAADAAAAWDGSVEPIRPGVLADADLVIDALFGAGLNRDVAGPALAVVTEMRERADAGDCHIVAVDMPSGIDGDTGQIRGAAASADLTVTFFAAKPGHLLLPGRDCCGELRVIDIGIADAVLDRIGVRQGVNHPAYWSGQLPERRLSDHKYRRGHAVIAGGGEMSGAALLAAAAARRVGAGLLTVAAPTAMANVYRARDPGVLVTNCDSDSAFADIIGERRRNGILVGPGLGVSAGTRAFALAALASGKAVVLDADALTVFAENTDMIARARTGPLVITPHDGEFIRMFPDLGSMGKLDRARIAAGRIGSVVVLKGADTVISAPDGRALINRNAPPFLATGGTGDVLAGTILGLLAQGMDAFAASAAAVWVNAVAASSAGPMMLAEDLPPRLADGVAEARSCHHLAYRFPEKPLRIDDMR